MLNDQKAQKIASKLTPEGGWFHSQAGEMVKLALQELLNEGLTELKAANIIGAVIVAIREEYGE